jgi:MGT family glycosyltransferase
MRRLLYFSFPAHGHINPTLPVMKELVKRGECVAYYATAPFAAAIRATGAEFRCYAAPFRMPESGAGRFERVSTAVEALLDLSSAVLDCHLAEARALAPVCILHDSFAPWGRLAADLLGLPEIASAPSILINRKIDARYGPDPVRRPADPRLTPEWYAGLAERCRAQLVARGVANPPAPPDLLQTYGHRNLVYTSRAFQPSAEAFDAQRFHFVGPCIDFRPEAPDFPFELLDGRPLVLVSLGTVYANRPEFLRACLEELAGGGYQVVLATGSAPPASLGPFPENAIVRPIVPQIEILRRAAVFVTHAGMNSVQEALFHGVPLVMAPQAADQFWISARTAELGAGLAIDSGSIAPGGLRRAVAKVLEDRKYAEAAARLGSTLHAAGGSGRAADVVQEFIARRQ